MTKVCPKCRSKNFDDAKYCQVCEENIKNVEIVPDAPIPDDFPDFKPRGREYNYSLGRPFTLGGIFFSALSFLIGGILFIGIAYMLSGIGLIRGDRLSILPLLLATLSLILLYFILA
jgi:hypothetical protein